MTDMSQLLTYNWTGKYGLAMVDTLTTDKKHLNRARKESSIGNPDTGHKNPKN